MTDLEETQRKEHSHSASEGDSTGAAILPLDGLREADFAQAGGKGANLGEMIAAGLPVPSGFVVGSAAYRSFLDESNLKGDFTDILSGLDVEDVSDLQHRSVRVGAVIDSAPVAEEFVRAISAAYSALGEGQKVVVRSSAVGEDSADASFAGMNESFLNVSGPDAVAEAVKKCWESLFSARSLYYRSLNGLPVADAEIAVVVQRQIDSTRAGVMFTADPATGVKRTVIEGSFGLGDAVVGGTVRPVRYVVEPGDSREHSTRSDQPDGQVLSESEIRQLAKLGTEIESLFGAPQDIEWAFDDQGDAWIVQARPITVHGRPAAPPKSETEPERILTTGLGASPGVASGRVHLASSPEDAPQVKKGDVLVAEMTAPDWVPLMRRAAAIITDSGGITCHAAIVARELGIPCVVGTGNGTRVLTDGSLVTVDAGRGQVIAGASAAESRTALPAEISSGEPPSDQRVTATRVLLNLSEPSRAREIATNTEADGVGLLRAELMLIEALRGEHPRAMIEAGRSEEFVDRMSDGMIEFASAFSPMPVTYRSTDLRSNEFRRLKGGSDFEPEESNPMIGYRGAARYIREPAVFSLELEAVARVREAGYENFHLMLPFVRTVTELQKCVELIEGAGLSQSPGFELWVMAEVPSILFNLESLPGCGVSGISVGTNDLTQLILGVDRDSDLLADVFDERDPAVVTYLRELIRKAGTLGLSTSICGQAPAVHPEYAEMLVRAGIDSISVTPDALTRTRRLVAQAERRVMLDSARAGCPTC